LLQEDHPNSRKIRAEKQRKLEIMASHDLRLAQRSRSSPRKSASRASVQPIAVKARIRAGIIEDRAILSSVPLDQRTPSMPMERQRTVLRYDSTIKGPMTFTRKWASQQNTPADTTPGTAVSGQTGWSGTTAADGPTPDSITSPVRRGFFSSVSPLRNRADRNNDDDDDLESFEEFTGQEANEP
jgi:hypothetical protein